MAFRSDEQRMYCSFRPAFTQFCLVSEIQWPSFVDYSYFSPLKANELP